eukprot:TRINITY_DN2562_c0_g1_i10.p1 TRINITY_DN2562_c0_g1~~TRINITY_DN2562_c0_g1_i10.p1  ORF type:complete len:327 (+),score=81.22 TRINITY_DN2562_c0_g1_i10:68-1048(+)
MDEQPEIDLWILDHPDFEKVSVNGQTRIKSKLTQHELPPKLSSLVSYTKSKKYILAKDSSHDYSQYGPYIVPSTRPGYLYCTLTQKMIHKKPSTVELHIMSKKYQNKLTEKERRSQQKKEPVPDSENEASTTDNPIEEHTKRSKGDNESTSEKPSKKNEKTEKSEKSEKQSKKSESEKQSKNSEKKAAKKKNLIQNTNHDEISQKPSPNKSKSEEEEESHSDDSDKKVIRRGLVSLGNVPMEDDREFEVVSPDLGLVSEEGTVNLEKPNLEEVQTSPSLSSCKTVQQNRPVDHRPVGMQQPATKMAGKRKNLGELKRQRKKDRKKK